MTLTAVSYDAPDCPFKQQIPYQTRLATGLTGEYTSNIMNFSDIIVSRQTYILMFRTRVVIRLYL